MKKLQGFLHRNTASAPADPIESSAQFLTTLRPLFRFFGSQGNVKLQIHEATLNKELN